MTKHNKNYFWCLFKFWLYTLLSAMLPLKALKKKRGKYQRRLEDNKRLVISDLPTVDKLLNRTFHDQQAICNYYSNEDIMRVNLVTDSISSASLLGGVATSLIIATELAKSLDLQLRIITRGDRANASNYFDILSLHGISPSKNVAFYSDYDRTSDGDKKYKLDVTKKDIFIATIWWSAKAIKKTSIRKRFFHIIQDAETNFHPYGDKHLQCSQVMADEDVDYIVNSKSLYEYCQKYYPVIYKRGIFFEPSFPLSLYKPKNLYKKHTGKYKLFFYSRPNHNRNLFYHGVEALDKSIECGILDTSEWDIYTLGANSPQLLFKNGYRAINLGQLSWKSYAEFLGEIDLSFSLMYSPHMSYPPFDVASSGGVVVTNKFENKTAFPYCDNVILADLNIQSLLDSMKKAVALAKDHSKRLCNFQRATIPRSWEESLAEVAKYVRERI
jgi:hypothetical protein